MKKSLLPKLLFVLGLGTGTIANNANSEEIKTPYGVVSALSDTTYGKRLQISIKDRIYEITDDTEDGFVSPTNSKEEIDKNLEISEIVADSENSYKKNETNLSEVFIDPIKGYDGDWHSVPKEVSELCKKIYLEELKKGIRFVDLDGLKPTKNLSDEEYAKKYFIKQWFVENTKSPDAVFPLEDAINIKMRAKVPRDVYTTYVTPMSTTERDYRFIIYQEDSRLMTTFKLDELSREERQKKFIEDLPEILDSMNVKGKVIVEDLFDRGTFVPETYRNKLKVQEVNVGKEQIVVLEKIL